MHSQSETCLDPSRPLPTRTGMMTTRPPRIGAILNTRSSVPNPTRQACKAADCGFDVVLVPDHLGYSAPMPSLIRSPSQCLCRRIRQLSECPCQIRLNEFDR